MRQVLVVETHPLSIVQADVRGPDLPEQRGDAVVEPFDGAGFSATANGPRKGLYDLHTAPRQSRLTLLQAETEGEEAGDREAKAELDVGIDGVDEEGVGTTLESD